MKQFITMILAGCSLAAVAAPQANYANYGQVNAPLNIDAIVFQNFGNFDIVNSFSSTNPGSTSGFTGTFTPFVTQDTLYFTNAGTMIGSPGFRFDRGTATSRYNASSFYNSGTITGEDTPPSITIAVDSSGDSINFPVASAEPSDLLVFATNINNLNTMSVGNIGLLQMTGSNITLANSALTAGTVSEIDPDDFTGRSQSSIASKTTSYFADPAEVYDLFWGITNGDTVDVSSIIFPTGSGTYDVNIQAPAITVRGINATFTFSFGASMAAYVYTNQSDQTNIYYNMVFLDTNFGDTNISANVAFTPLGTIQTVPAVKTDGNATGDIIQFSESVTDIISGQTVTNSIYLLDSGAEVSGMSEIINAAYVNGYSRPNPFEITTSQPAEWLFAQPTNAVLDTTQLWAPQSFAAQKVPLNDAIYGVQIGRDPENVNGQFLASTNFVSFSNTNLYSTNFDVFEFLDLFSVSDLPDITNEPGRIELFGNHVDMSSMRLRGEGLVSVVASNLVGAPLASDYGNINADLNETNGQLVVNGFFPTNFQRLRGNLTAWSADFVNTETNVGGVSVTNVFRYHILWVEPNLRSHFTTSIRNLALRATNSNVVQDNLRVINNSLFMSSNLTFNSAVTLTQNAGSLNPTNIPRLKNFKIDTNGSLLADNIIDIGFNTTVGQTSPVKRKYSVLSITNLGSLGAIAPLLQASNIENDGVITASSGGSAVIEAANLGMGLLSLTNGAFGGTNGIVADGNVFLSANFIGITNSVIVAGQGTGNGIIRLESTATGEITDFVPSDPATNAGIVNQWFVTGGFSLPVKPATGDLFGTEITTIATNYTVAVHTWAGADLGATSDGFQDNVVIGHLKLSRQSPGATLHFSGATPGGQYGMYVDYLELDTNSYSYSDYRNGMIIDPNLTIYFAGCNVDPIKLETVYTNRLVWVPSFYGPNSTVSVPYTNCTGVTQYCLMNSNLAFSPVIGFFGSTPNLFNQPFVLNDPAGNCTNIATNFTSCGGGFTTFRDFLIASGNSTNYVNVDISTVGSGAITPAIKEKQLAVGKKYELTATPDKGWDFAGWTTSGLPGGTDSSSRTLKFTLQNDLMLTANFVPKAYTLVEGTYNGLFLASNAVPTAGTSGSFTLSVTAAGGCSGRLSMGGVNYAFAAKVPTNGLVNTEAKHGNQTIAVNLQFDMTGASGRVTGYAGSVAVPLLGDIVPSWSSKNPSPYAGSYTFILTNSASNNLPIGNSYGTVTISKAGILSSVGGLADGNAFSQSVPVSKDGFWPFYDYVARGGDFLAGWISFSNSPVSGTILNPGSLVWSKTASSKSHYYPAGFTNMFNLTGSVYGRPGKGSTALTLANPVVILTGGGLAKSFTDAVATKNGLVYTSTNLTLSINPGGGTFSGRLTNGKGEPSFRLNGVIMQDQDSAYGYFMGTNEESGAVLFESQ